MFFKVLIVGLFVSCFNSNNKKKVIPEAEVNDKSTTVLTNKSNDNEVGENCFCKKSTDANGNPAPNQVRDINVDKTLLITDSKTIEHLNQNFRFSSVLARDIHGEDVEKDASFFRDFLSRVRSNASKVLESNWKDESGKPL